MAAFVIAEQLEVTDPTKLEEYGKSVRQTIVAHGGKVVAVGNCEPVEGPWKPGRLVLIQFDNMDKAKGWYNSAEYQPLIKIRQAGSRGNLVFLNGL
jgi:uncharacterized protein (DUF1330 family)